MADIAIWPRSTRSVFTITRNTRLWLTEISPFTKLANRLFMDGEWIRTGDILHGDANGIGRGPIGCARRTSGAVETIRDREQRLMTYIESDSFDLEKVKSGKGY